MNRNRHTEIQTLARLSAMVNSSLDMNRVLDNSMKFVEELMDAEASAIFEADFERRELCFRLARGEKSGKARELRISMDEGVAGWTLREGRPCLVADTRADERFSSRVDIHSGFQTRSILSVPLRTRDRLTGVLQVLNKREGTFTPDDVELLTLVSNQIGIAMENARLYESLSHRFVTKCSQLDDVRARLDRQERLAALGRLSQGLAHEVRNPVMSIGGFARRLREKLPDGVPGREYVDIIIKESSRLEKMVRDLEEYANLPTPEKRPVDLGALVAERIASWRDRPGTEGVEFKMEMPGPHPEILADPPLLARALDNLIANAVEALPGGAGTVRVSLEWNDGKAVLRIADNGRGIPPEDLPYLLEPFSTSKSRGCGMGLPMVHRIVADHGGEIRIDSQPGKGTTVSLFLPA